MTPIKQRFRHDPAAGIFGDCHRAAIASVLSLPLDEVPHFGDGGPTGDVFADRERDFLRTRGLVPINVMFDAPLDRVLECLEAMNPGVYYLLGGKSRTGVNHTVVGLGGRIVHDPSLSESGIVGPCEDGYYWVTWFGSDVAAAVGQVSEAGDSQRVAA